MFDLEEYKEMLVDYYRWEIDNTEEERNERRKMLVGKDDYLTKIINDTEDFIYFILTKMQEENNTYDNRIFIYLDLIGEEATPYSNSICFNLHGGWPSDTFFYLEDPTKLISMSLLRKFFQGFRTKCNCEDVERYNEKEGTGWVDSYWQFFIGGPIKDFNVLYNKARNVKGKELVNTLKKN